MLCYMVLLLLLLLKARVLCREWVLQEGVWWPASHPAHGSPSTLTTHPLFTTLTCLTALSLYIVIIYH